MLDIKFIRQHPDKVKEGCRKKGVKVNIDRLLELDKKMREKKARIEGLRMEHKNTTAVVRDMVEKGGKPVMRDILGQAYVEKEEKKKEEEEFKKLEDEFKDLILQVPNLSQDDVPEGKDESENVPLRDEGTKPEFDFEAKDYLAIAENLDLIDTKRAAKTSGTRFGFLKREAALLEFALVNLAFDTLTKEDFIPVVPPVMINAKMMRGMGYLERGSEETYFIEKDKLYLVGTSEQIIGPMHADEKFEEKDLPKRYIGFSSCFRREAGAYGQDTRGILRVHQFDKAEMFSFCHPAKSEQEHLFFLKMEEKLMQKLGIPYKVVQMCTGDLGDPTAAKYDIEAWMPGQGKYRETHSTSNCTDFQARRLNIRYRDKKTNKLEFVHTLNGTALAIGRTLIAIIENYQQKDGSIKIPQVLQEYLSFKVIKR